MIQRTHPNRLRTLACIGALAAATSLAACGAAADDGSAAGSDVADVADVADTADDGEVASIGTVAEASSTDSSDSGDDDGGSGDGEPDEQAIQEAALEFAKCMREHGIDMPDPTFNADGAGGGGVMIEAGGPGEAIDPEEMDAANEACQPIMEAVRGEFEPPDPEELEQMTAEALEFAQCMREHGVDMPDPQFSEDGAMTVSVGAGRLGEDGEGPDPIEADKSDEATEAGGGPGGGMLSVSPDDGDGGAGDNLQINVDGGVDE